MKNRKEYYKEYYKRNREKKREYYKNNKEKCKERIKEWKENNKEKCNEYNRKWRRINTEYFRQRQRNNTEYFRIYYKQWRKNNRKYHRQWQKNKRQKDPKFRLDENMRNLMRISLKGLKAGKKWENLVGYTINDLVKHLESQFDESMSWQNYGSYWWVDHIIPRSHFKYETAEDPQFKECWALSNLQPLKLSKNRSKKNYYSS